MINQLSSYQVSCLVIPEAITLHVHHEEKVTTLSVPKGTNLRAALLGAGLSPYTSITQRLNCGGRGLCATCGVWMIEGAPPPNPWHGSLAQRFGYPRLSCQVTVKGPMTIVLDADKKIWGNRRPI